MIDIYYLFKGGPVDGKHLSVPCHEDGTPIAPYYKIAVPSVDGLCFNRFTYWAKLWKDEHSTWYEFELKE